MGRGSKNSLGMRLRFGRILLKTLPSSSSGEPEATMSPETLAPAEAVGRGVWSY